MTARAGEIVVALLLSSPIGPDALAHWHDGENHKPFAVDCQLPPHDVTLVDQYYRERVRPAPSGLSRKLRRGGRLPPGWEQRLEPLPVIVDRQLAALPRGTRRALLDGYLVIYEPESETIVDAAALFRLH